MHKEMISPCELQNNNNVFFFFFHALVNFEKLVYFASINMFDVRQVGKKHPKYISGVRVHSAGRALWRAGLKHLSSETTRRYTLVLIDINCGTRGPTAKLITRLQRVG